MKGTEKTARASGWPAASRVFAAFCCVCAARAATPPESFFAGVDANYSLGMEAEGRGWSWEGRTGELFSGMATRGARPLRIRLWTGDAGQNGKDYATRVVKRALAAGMDPYLVIFLSEDWADLMKQPAPAAWKDLAIPERAAAVRDYSRSVVAHFRREGLKSHLYEIGNEIDYGICGVYPGKGVKKTPAGLGREHWPQAATLIKASQEGVLAADPEAKFMLHIAHWWDVDFCAGFFRFMLGSGARVDYAGLSYFPSSNIGGSLEMAQFGEVVSRLHEAVDRPVIVPETAYPSTPDFKGQFSRWKKETPGYPLSPDGQRRWLADFLGFCAAHPAVAGVYYWSPEWCGEGMWKAFALFDPAGEARPAWAAFSPGAAGRRPPRASVYWEIDADGAHPVPLGDARARAVEALRRLLKRHGRVNADYIAAISREETRAGDYRVNLRASLSGNLDLVRAPAAAPAAADTPSWAAALEKIDPERERLVLFVRDAGARTTGRLEEAAAKRRLEVVRHPVEKDAPLKFGLGQDWQKGLAEAPAADAD